MNWRILLTSSLVVISVACFVDQETQARPLYSKVWRRVYERWAKAGCAACHPVKVKSTLNAYGERLKTELGGRNIKDQEIIEAAIRRIPIKFPQAKPIAPTD